MQGLLLAHIIYTMSEGNRSTSAGLRRQSLAQGFVGLIWCTVPNIPLPATFCLPLRPGSQAHMHACIHQDGKISRMSAFDNEAILGSLSCLCFCNMLHAPSMIHFSPFPAGRSFPPAGGSSPVLPGVPSLAELPPRFLPDFPLHLPILGPTKLPARPGERPALPNMK